MAPGQSRAHSLAIRQVCASWLSMQLLGDDWMTWAPIISHIMRFADDNGIHCLWSYLRKISIAHSDGGLWADNMTASIACHALGINITIYSQDLRTGALVLKADHTYGDNSQPRAYLLFSGDTDQGHYQPLRTTADHTVEPLTMATFPNLPPPSVTASAWASPQGIARLRRLAWEFFRHETGRTYSMSEAWHGHNRFLTFIQAGVPLKRGGAVNGNSKNKRHRGDS